MRLAGQDAEALVVMTLPGANSGGPRCTRLAVAFRPELAAGNRDNPNDVKLTLHAFKAANLANTVLGATFV